MLFFSGLCVCIGVGFVMVEGVLMLLMIFKYFWIMRVEGCDLEFVVYLMVWSKNGIWLIL